MTDKDRAEFEAWWDSFTQLGKTSYELSVRNMAWQAWQHQQRQIEELKERLANERGRADHNQNCYRESQAQLTEARERVKELEKFISAIGNKTNDYDLRCETERILFEHKQALANTDK